jgi:hypothetical protein
VIEAHVSLDERQVSNHRRRRQWLFYTAWPYGWNSFAPEPRAHLRGKNFGRDSVHPLSHFILEVRDVTIPPVERRCLPNKGWQRVTTRGCLSLLESAGVIETRRLT